MTSPLPPQLTLTDLSIVRGTRPLVSGLSVTVAGGEALWLSGPNGIGKSSILLACAGLLRPESGTIDWQGGMPAFAADRGPERAGLTLTEELRFWQRLYGDSETTDARLDAVGLAGRGDTPIGGLSAGQRKRLSLARLLSSGRKAWLLDEPLAALDADGRGLVLKSLTNHLAGGGLALIASHHPVTLPAARCRNLVLERAV